MDNLESLSGAARKTVSWFVTVIRQFDVITGDAGGRRCTKL